MRAITDPAAVAALVKREELEKGRIEVWLMIPEEVRRLAMAISDLPDERANDDLSTFTRPEREHIHSALQRFMINMIMAEASMRETHPVTTILH